MSSGGLRFGKSRGSQRGGGLSEPVDSKRALIEIESSRMKMMNSNTQPAKIPGLRSGMVIRFKVVIQLAPDMRELLALLRARGGEL